MSVRTETERRILDGALTALARQGSRKLSMSEICDAAGVSRGTLYRYFGHKEEVLEALGSHIVGRLIVDLQTAIDENPSSYNRVPVVLEVMLGFWQAHPETIAIGRLEPGFVLSYIERALPEYHDAICAALAPILDLSHPVASGAATPEQLVDLFLRVVFSHYFIPFPDEVAISRLLISLASADDRALGNAPAGALAH